MRECPVQDRIWLVRLQLSKKMGAEEREIITDKASGKDIDRPGYQALKTTLLRPGDTLVIVSLDRLSRKRKTLKRNCSISGNIISD